MRALIRRSAGQTRNVIEIGEVVIDVAGRHVARGGEAVPLTAREYALLEYLALHRGELVTRTTLYEHLFDENDGDVEPMDVCTFRICGKNSARNSFRRAAAMAIALNE